jgi:hypothetical protein
LVLENPGAFFAGIFLLLVPHKLIGADVG